MVIASLGNVRGDSVPASTEGSRRGVEHGWQPITRGWQAGDHRNDSTCRRCSSSHCASLTHPQRPLTAHSEGMVDIWKRR